MVSICNSVSSPVRTLLQGHAQSFYVVHVLQQQPNIFSFLCSQILISSSFPSLHKLWIDTAVCSGAMPFSSASYLTRPSSACKEAVSYEDGGEGG